MRGTTQLEENILQLKKLTVFTVHRYFYFIFTMKAPGRNSFFYLYQLSPNADSLETGIEELHGFPSKLKYKIIGYSFFITFYSHCQIPNWKYQKNVEVCHYKMA
jgi:hypothetical protein